jgi:arylsulfatase A-like enzyme
MNLIQPFLALSLAAWACVGRSAPPPNIILVLADDLGAADLSCYGQRAFRTPNLDLMAAEGMRFTQAYSGCSVCAPARSTLMTGRHMGQTSVRSNTGGVPLLDGDVTLAEVLKAAGYATGGFGKWGLGDLETEGVPERQGFDRFFGYYHQIHAHSYYPDYLIDTGQKVPLPGNRDFARNHPGPGGVPELNQGQPAQFAHTLIKQAMFEWIRANRDKPFFCYAPWTLPHAKFQMPESHPAWQAVRDRPWSEAAKGHAALTLLLDRDLGELLDLLRELRMDGRTVVFFCSDNGPDDRYAGQLDSAGSLRGAKGSLYEGGIRVPLLVRWPGVIPPAQTCAFPVYFPDLLPTLAELAGVGSGLPVPLDGVSFVPMLRDRPALQLRHDAFYWELTPVNWERGGALEPEGTAQAARLGRWKGIRPRLDAAIELYDLSADPGETNNVADHFPDVVKEVARVFVGFRTEPRPQPEPERPEGRKFR